MPDLLREQLTEDDIDWLVSLGEKRTISAMDTLVKQNEPLRELYILIEGELTSLIKDSEESALGRAYSALISEGKATQELFSYKQGDIFGEGSLLSTTISPVTIQAKTDSIVLIIPCKQLKEHLNNYPDFAVRFYRAIALFLLNRYEFLLDHYLDCKRWQVSPWQDRSILFDELYDHDIDWMVTQGEVQSHKAGTLIIQAGQPPDNLYIILKGLLSLTVTEQKASTLNQVFAKLTSSELEDETPSGKEIGRAIPGEIMGETALVDSRLPKITVSALEDSVLLAIPRQKLLAELQQHIEMSSRLYRVLAILISERLTCLISRLGYGKHWGNSAQSLSSNQADLEAIDHPNRDGNRFNSMLKRLKI